MTKVYQIPEGVQSIIIEDYLEFPQPLLKSTQEAAQTLQDYKVADHSLIEIYNHPSLKVIDKCKCMSLLESVNFKQCILPYADIMEIVRKDVNNTAHERKLRHFVDYVFVENTQSTWVGFFSPFITAST